MVQLLEDVKAKKIDLIVFTKLDRWFRSLSDYFKVQELLEKNNVNWRTIQEDYDTSTAAGRLKINIMLSVAQDEADRTGERIKFIFEDKVQRGEAISGKVPLGYKIENKKIVIDLKTAPVAQDIFRQYTVLRSIGALRWYVMETHNLVYTHSGLKAMLTNERYIGRAHGQDDFCPPLIPVQQFELTQRFVEQRAQRNAQKSNHTYLFTSLVYCAECGRRLSAHVVHNRYIYYRCTRYEKLHLCTHKKRTSELVLEQWLLENLIASFEAHNLSLLQNAAAKKQKIDEAKIKRKMEKLKDLYLNDLIDRDTYEADYITLRDALHAANTPETKPAKPVDIQAIKTALNAYKKLSEQGKKEFWQRIVDKITITNDDHFFVTPVSHN